MSPVNVLKIDLTTVELTHMEDLAWLYTKTSCFYTVGGPLRVALLVC